MESPSDLFGVLPAGLALAQTASELSPRLLANLIPAVRAGRVDPSVTLREE